MTAELMDLAAARRSLREVVAPTQRTETVSLAEAEGRVLASSVVAGSNVPGHPRAAMDGYAVRAADIGDDETPATLELVDGAVAAGEAVCVQTGSELPAGADTVVRLERAERSGGCIEVTRAISEGKDVAPIGEDVTEGQHLYDPGHRLRPSDLGLLKSSGTRAVEVYARPTVALLPTGGELVEADPDPGEVVETNSLTVGRYVEQWGGRPERVENVPDELDALERAIRVASEAEFVVTIGGSSVGESDLVPDAIRSIGKLRVHGVAIKPGHPVAIGVVAGTPILALPGYPVSAIITAVQLLRPALNWHLGTQPSPFPATRATLAAPIHSDRGTRRYARVRFQTPETGDEAPAETSSEPLVDAADHGGLDGRPPELRAVPTSHSGAGVLSSVALADGWVEVPEETGDLSAGTEVTVQDWEWYP